MCKLCQSGLIPCGPPMKPWSYEHLSLGKGNKECNGWPSPLRYMNPLKWHTLFSLLKTTYITHCSSKHFFNIPLFFSHVWQGKQEKIIFQHFIYILKGQPLLPGDTGKQMVKGKASSTCSFLTRGRWRVKGAGGRAHSILYLGLGAISLSLSLQSPKKVLTGVTGTFLGLQLNTEVSVLHTSPAQVVGTVPSSAHHLLPCIHLSGHSQEALLNTSSWSQLQNGRWHKCKYGI